jgi:hypothetical protein
MEVGDQEVIWRRHDEIRNGKSKGKTFGAYHEKLEDTVDGAVAFHPLFADRCPCATYPSGDAYTNTADPTTNYGAKTGNSGNNRPS